MIGLEKYLKTSKSIFDIGTGPNGSQWWKIIPPTACITGIDLYFFPRHLPKNVTVYQLDASLLSSLQPGNNLPKLTNGLFKKFHSEKVFWQHRFDLIVANHVLEHVTHPLNLIKGIKQIISPGGTVYLTFPESSNFTDIFYHLIHPDGGGHIQKLSRSPVINLFRSQGFRLLSCHQIPDDWLWLEKLYDYQNHHIQYFSQNDLKYLAKVFRKELTLKKGYFYGWEMTFKK
jgi:predicted SAM-dependent methyltransferase